MQSKVGNARPGVRFSPSAGCLFFTFAFSARGVGSAGAIGHGMAEISPQDSVLGHSVHYSFVSVSLIVCLLSIFGMRSSCPLTHCYCACKSSSKKCSPKFADLIELRRPCLEQLALRAGIPDWTIFSTCIPQTLEPAESRMSIRHDAKLPHSIGATQSRLVGKVQSNLCTCHEHP